MLNGKVVFISGASSGIGALAASMLAKRGAVPILTGRNERKLQDNAAAIGQGCAYYVMDVREMEQVESTVQAVIARYGKIDILLNNAGYGQFERFEAMPVEQFEAMMDTNYMGIVRCTKAVLPHMRRQGGGQIVNIASLAGKISSAKSTAYSATKHAVLGLTNALRMELRSSGITVTAVNPGPIATEFFDIADPTGNYVKNVGWMMMKPEAAAKAIVRAIERRREEIDMPFPAGAGVRLYGLFPRLADRLLGGWLNRK